MQSIFERRKKMSNVKFNMENLDVDKLQLLDSYIESIEDKKGSLIHILHKGQEIFGYLPKELQIYISRKVDVPAAKVNGVVSFYSYFTQNPRGKHTISVCMGTACFVKGSDKIMHSFMKKLDTSNNSITADGLFTVRDVRCIGACGLAPVVMVDDKVFGHVKEEDVDKIIAQYNGEAK
jgi:NADH:ubiquinone oxidoreductase subunit E